MLQRRIMPKGRRFSIQIAVGEVYSRLTVLELTTIPHQGRAVVCRCECGAVITRPAFALKIGYTKSCGCLKRETDHTRTLTHGQSKSPTYKAWQQMKQRCTMPRHPSWKYYGAIGVKVCERWLHSYENFVADMGERPSTQRSLDRIDPYGHYKPSNCRWANKKEQVENRRKFTRKFMPPDPRPARSPRPRQEDPHFPVIGGGPIYPPCRPYPV